MICESRAKPLGGEPLRPLAAGRAKRRDDAFDLAVLKGGEEGRILVAGKSLESALVVAVSGLDEETAMPHEGVAV